MTKTFEAWGVKNTETGAISDSVCYAEYAAKMEAQFYSVSGIPAAVIRVRVTVEEI